MCDLIFSMYILNYSVHGKPNETWRNKWKTKTVLTNWTSLPGMDKSLVGLVVLVDEQFLPIFGELRATDSIAMVLKRYAF